MQANANTLRSLGYEKAALSDERRRAGRGEKNTSLYTAGVGKVHTLLRESPWPEYY